MREVRKIRRTDYLGAGDHVQGIRLVYHGLFRQDEAADRRHIETNTDDNDDSTLRFVCNRSSAGDDVHTIAGSCVSCHRRNLRCRIIRQRTGIRHTVQLKVTRPD